MNDSLLWRWIAKELSLDDFLAQARQDGVTSFELTVYHDDGNQDCLFDVYRLSFYLDAVGYRQEEVIMTRKSAFLRSIAFTDETCRQPVPLISTSPWRPLMQEIAMQAEHYTAIGETELSISLPWRAVQTFALQPQETFEAIYARLGEIGEERRKVRVR